MITFILPTKDRVNQLNFFCKTTFKKFKNLRPKYVIVDASNSINSQLNQRNLKKYKNVKIIKQKSKGIQKGCIEAIPHINTKYATFLYDDDVMGQHVSKIYKENFKNKKIFSFGCGVVEDIKKNVKFNKLKILNLPKEEVLTSYFGNNFNKVLKKNLIKEKLILPVSPICTCFETNFLIKWKKILFKFTKNNVFRNYFFFKKDVGPDMLVYLMQIGYSYKKVKFYYPHSVKFSSHTDSISIIYGNSFLRIGYWLARICYIQNEKILNYKEKNNAYTYLVIIGLVLLFSNIFNLFYLKNILIEFVNLLKTKNRFSTYFFIKYISERMFSK